jgi:heme A synthase
MGVLFTIAIVAYRRRRSRRYLVVTAVIGLLTARTLVGIGTVLDAVPMTVHHIIAHGIDFVTAAALLYIVYRSPTVASS